jgi:hypothetical protein
VNVTKSKSVEVDVPAVVTELNLLHRVDYEDAFQIGTSRQREPPRCSFDEGAHPFLRCALKPNVLPHAGRLR